MQVVVVTQPEPLVELEAMKIALGEDGDERNDLIEGLILGAQSALDGPNGSIGITVAVQSVEVLFDSFCREPLDLPGQTIALPLTSVKYRDATGAEVALDPTLYGLRNGSRLVQATTSPWPSVSTGGGTVRVAYDLGIDDAADPRVHLMKTAIIMHVKMTLDMDNPEAYQRAIDGLTASMQVWRV